MEIDSGDSRPISDSNAVAAAVTVISSTEFIADSDSTASDINNASSDPPIISAAPPEASTVAPQLGSSDGAVSACVNPEEKLFHQIATQIGAIIGKQVVLEVCSMTHIKINICMQHAYQAGMGRIDF